MFGFTHGKVNLIGIILIYIYILCQSDWKNIIKSLLVSVEKVPTVSSGVASD